MSTVHGTAAENRGVSPGAVFLFLLAILLLAFASSWVHLFAFWWNSSTYSYALLLLPLAAVSAYLRWRTARPLYGGPRSSALVLLAGLALIWLMARIANVRVVEYLATVMTVPTLFLYFWNWPMTRRLLFPFALLLLTVPFWDLLLNLSLQGIAARGTVFLLDLIGVPTYREGLSVVLPNGRFDVEESCSGLNFLLVSFALSTLYASYMYHSDRKRLRYIAAFAVASVLGNILRVFAIALLGYLTDLKHPLVHDHAVIGWLIFAVIAAIMFYVGRRWADGRPATSTTAEHLPSIPRNRALRISAVALPVILAGPLILAGSGNVAAPAHTALALPPGQSEIQGPLATHDNWQPVYHGATRMWRAAYRREGETLQVFAAYYARQRQGAELIHQDNRVADHERWLSVLAAPRRQTFQGGEVDEFLLRGSDGRERLLWRWYVIGGLQTASPRMAKLYEVRDALYSHLGAFVVMVAVDIHNDPDAARLVLKHYLTRLPRLYDLGKVPE